MIPVKNANGQMPEPFYFSSQGRKLFGLYTGPQGRDEAVVLCYPAPQDIMRSYQAHVQLHRRLQDLGYAVLRFDYAGTGDSEDSAPTLALWVDNIVSAVSEVKKRSAVSRVSLIGTRLGGNLALQASLLIGVKRVVLWDAIADGSELIARFESVHRHMLGRVPDEPPLRKNQKNPDQCCGFPWPRSLREEIAAIRPDTLDTACSRLFHIQSTAQPPWEAVNQRWIADGKSIRTIVSDENMHWDNDLYIKLRIAPPRSLQAITQIFEEA